MFCPCVLVESSDVRKRRCVVRIHSGTVRRSGGAFVSVVALTVVLLAAIAAGCAREEGRTAKDESKPVPPVAAAKEHMVIIMSSPTEPNWCLCVRADLAQRQQYTQEVTARPGEWIVWQNGTGRNVTLLYRMENRLFGVKEAVVYAEGEPLKLQVRPDAVVGEHRYDPDCGTTEPGPIIIVPPPPEP